MSGSRDAYQMRTFAFLDKLRACKGSDAIRTAIVEEMSALGFECVSCWRLPAPGHDPEPGIMLNTYPAEYVRNYIDGNYVERDPVLRPLRKTPRTYSWADVKATTQIQSKLDEKILSEATDCGLIDGLIVPVLSRSGAISLFCPCGEEPDMTPDARNAIEIMGTMAIQMLQQALIDEVRDGDEYRPLTRREREILQWVAHGKSDDEIGEILHISAGTVLRHVENAKRKLDTYKRTTAVVVALRRGEIAL